MPICSASLPTVRSAGRSTRRSCWNGAMDSRQTLLELFSRLPPLARAATDGLTSEQLAWRIGPDANTIAWLVWHSARVQDHHVSELRHADQAWTTGGWAQRVGLDADPDNTGYGHSPSDVGSVRPGGVDDLLDYFDAVQAATVAFLESLSDSDLDEIVDRRWDPPVTMGVRLVSVADDSLQHLGQAAYLRGVLGT